MIASPATISPGKALTAGRSLTATLAPGAPRPASDMIATLANGLVGSNLKGSDPTANGASNFALAAMDILAAQNDASLPLSGRTDPSLPDARKAQNAPMLDADFAAITDTPAQTAIRPQLFDTRAALSISIDPQLPIEAGSASSASPIDEQSGHRDAQKPVLPIARIPASQSAEQPVDPSQLPHLDISVEIPVNYAGVSRDAAQLADPEMAAEKAPQALKPKPELSSIWTAEAGKSVPTGKDLPEILAKQGQANLDGKPALDQMSGQSPPVKAASPSAPVELISDVSLLSTRLNKERPGSEVRQAITEARQPQFVRNEAVFRPVVPPEQMGSASAIAADEIEEGKGSVSLLPLAPASPDVERAAAIASAKFQPRADGQATVSDKYEVARVQANEASLPVEKASDDFARPRPKSSFDRVAAAELSKADNAAIETASAKLATQSQPLANQNNSAALVQNSPAAIASAPNLSVSNNSAQPSVTERMIAPQLDQTIDQLTEAREASRTARSELTVRHAEFGAINMRLEAAAGGDLRAILANRDPGFVPAIQAALADRAIAAASETSSSANNHSGSRQPENGSSGAHTNNQNGGGWGSNSGSEGHYGSSLGGERSTSQPSLEQLEGERHSDLSRDEDATGTLNPQGMRDKDLFA